MKKCIEKQLKRFLKRKMCITEGVIVVFLITGAIGLASTVTISEDYLSTFSVSSGQTRVIINPDVLVEVNNENAIEINNIGNKVDIINHGTISATSFYGENQDDIFASGNGIAGYSENNSAIETILNTGSISAGMLFLNSGIEDLDGSGNGVTGYSISENGNGIGTVINTGSISGSVLFGNNITYSSSPENGVVGYSEGGNDTISYSGNGIAGYSQNKNGIGNVINFGQISGQIIFANNDIENTDYEAIYSGNGIVAESYSDKDALDRVYNLGEISGKAATLNLLDTYMVGNGIYADSEDGAAINYLYNDGKITGYAEIMKELEELSYVESVANGIVAGNGAIVELENEGLIVGNAIINSESNPYIDEVANGIISDGDNIGTVKNVGIIKGSLEVNGPDNYVYDSANGIYGDYNITTVENKGLISGYVYAYFDSDDYLSFLESSGNGIYADDNIDEITNSGVIEGESASESGILADYSGNGIYAGDVIAKIENSGIISGEVYPTGFHESGIEYTNTSSGNGIAASQINTLENTGYISGGTYTNGLSDMSESGNGAYAAYEIGAINNSGIIRGFVTTGDSDQDIDNSGNGIMIGTEYVRTSGIGNLLSASNSGIIAGFADVTDAYQNDGIGNGIYVAGDLESLENSGVIRGFAAELPMGRIDVPSISSGNGIYAGGSLGQVINNGLIASNTDAINSIDFERDVFNKGVIASGFDNSFGNIDNHGYILNVNPWTGEFSGVYNKAVDSIIDGKYIDNDDNNHLNGSNLYKDYIFNGIGVDGLSTLVIAENANKELQDSIVNAYGTAVGMEGGATLTASNTIFNGGGLGEFVYDVIHGINGFNTLDFVKSIVNGDIFMEDGNNTVSILGNSIMNGDIIVGGNANEVTLGNSVIVNGDLISNGTGSGNVLNLGVAGDNGNLNIFGTIEDFATINVDGKVTLFEDATIMKGEPDITRGLDDVNYAINLNGGSELTFRIDGTETRWNNKVVGHALFDTDYVIDGAGTLIVGAAGLGEDTVIGMGSTDISGLLDEQIQAGSIVHTAEKELNEWWADNNEDDRYDIKITVAKSLEKETAYQRAIWDSIYSTKQVGVLWPTTFQEYDKAWADLHVFLDSIYAGNPASRTGRAAMEAMGSFNDLVFNNPFVPNPNKWVVYGGALYNNIDVDSSFDNYSGTYDQTFKSKTWGGFARGEYGFNATSSAGILFGGSKTDLSLSGGSESDGNSAYIGLYGKKKVGDFKLYAGAGYQYTDWSGTRVAANEVQGFRYDQDFSSNAANAYLGAKYMVELSKDYLLEPKAKLSYTYVDQEDITETGPLAVKIDGKSFDYLESELGFDFVANYVNSYGAAKIKLGASWLAALEGADEDSLTARMYTNTEVGSDFGLLVPSADKNKGKISLSYEFEQETGFSYYAGLDYIMSKNEKNFAGKLSVGYKF